LPSEFVGLFDLEYVDREKYQLVISGEIQYYRKMLTLDSNSKEDQLFKLLSLNLNFDDLTISCVWSVVSLKLALAFSNYKAFQFKRKQETRSLFVSDDWELKDQNDLRKLNMEQFEKKVVSYPWNSSEDEKLSPILPALFATDEDNAWKYVSTGFQTKTTGSYGTGYYLNTSAQYLTPYLSEMIEPSIIICLTLPGYPYPVISGKDIQKGKGLFQGHQSHYVITNPDGTPVEKPSTGLYYDELVVDQEGQILPVFVVCLKKDHNLHQLSQKFTRLHKEKESSEEQIPVYHFERENAINYHN